MKLNLPNKISLARIFLSFGLFVLMIVSVYLPPTVFYVIPTTHFTILDIVCFVVFILLASTDSVDGHIARSRNMVSDLGKILDPVADKLLVDGSLIILSARSPMLLPPLFVILLVGRDLVMDGVRMMAAKKGQIIPANIWGKLKTVFEMILIPVVIIRGFPFNYIDLAISSEDWAISSEAEYNSWLNGVAFSYDGELYAMIFCLGIGIVTVLFSIISSAIYLQKARNLISDDYKDDYKKGWIIYGFRWIIIEFS